MCSVIQTAYQKFNRVLGRAPKEPEQQGTDPKLTALMQRVLDAKQSHVQATLNDKWRRYNPILIGGDVFTLGYVGFETAKTFLPAGAQAASALGFAGLVCGVIGGVINIGVGIICLKESIQAFRNGDKVLGLRLLLDFICLTAIGVVMILASISIQLGFLGLGAFFAANPWLLPLLFFVVTIPLLLELAYRIKNVVGSKDLGSQMQLDPLKKLLEQKNPDWQKIEALYSHKENIFHLSPFKDEERAVSELSDKMEKLQANVGVMAGVEAFSLLTAIKKRNKEEALKQVATVQKRVREWNRSLYLRMFQQILYVVCFGLSMGALSPNLTANRVLNVSQNVLLVGANGIPAYMDTLWPFKRNTPMVVSKVEKAEVLPARTA